MTANPMWNQKFDATTYENDPFERFKSGVPPSSSADWGWIQHMVASLSEKGRMAMVLDTGAVSRGSGNQGSNKERDIRKTFVDQDLVECVILLPDNLFYNTTAPAIILVLNKSKKCRGEILLVNASKLFAKGKPKNYLEEIHVGQVANTYKEWRDEKNLATVITNDVAAKNDYNLSPSRYVVNGAEQEIIPLEEAVLLLAQAEEERQQANKELKKILDLLGVVELYHGSL